MNDLDAFLKIYAPIPKGRASSSSAQSPRSMNKIMVMVKLSSAGGDDETKMVREEHGEFKAVSKYDGHFKNVTKQKRE
jgi:hypothetical protein